MCKKVDKGKNIRYNELRCPERENSLKAFEKSFKKTFKKI